MLDPINSFSAIQQLCFNRLTHDPCRDSPLVKSSKPLDSVLSAPSTAVSN